jgi:hypothetical protein
MRDRPHERGRVHGIGTRPGASTAARKTKRRLWPAFLLALPGLIVGCYPGDFDDLEDFDTVTTLHGENVNFGAIQTYALPDTIIHIEEEGDDDDDDDRVELSREFDEHILKHVRENLNARGYQEVTAPTRPDVVVAVSAAATTVVGAYSSYWCDYWGWYGWYGYPCGYYPGYTYIYSYDLGTIFIDMLDVRPEALLDDQIDVLWTGAVRGVLGTADPVTEERIHDGIDQAFRQSPYLRSNP